MQSNNNGGHKPSHKTDKQEEEQQKPPVKDDEINFEFEGLSREDLIELVKNMKSVAKKEAEESTKVTQELVTLKKALLVSQQKVKELTREMDNRNAVEELGEQPPKKIPQIDEPKKQPEMTKSNENNLPKSADEDKDSVISTIMHLASSRHSRPLPLELNCEIFKCLKLPIQRKFIWGLGRDIYGMFGQKLLKKTKKIRNPHGNYWNSTHTRATVFGSLHVWNTVGQPNVFAEQPFPVSGPHCRVDGFPGTILYYYEVKGSPCMPGLSDNANPDNDNLWIGTYANSYAIRIPDCLLWNACWLDGKKHYFELSEGAVQPSYEHGINVHGCGLVLDPENKLWIFFTVNGKLFGQKIPINPTVDRLFPAVTMTWYRSSFVANFGDDPAKPFEYDIQNCPGLELSCI